MASKKAAPTDDELLAQLDSLSTGPQSKPKTTRPTTTRTPKSNHGNTSQTEQDLLAELGSLAQRSSSRPGTPSLKSTSRTQANSSPKRTSTATPPPGRPSEDKPTTNTTDRKSADSTRSSHQAFTPATTTADESPDPEASAPAKAATGGGWGGWFTSVATAAVTQARARVEDLQNTEEAQKWTEQIRGRVGAVNLESLKGIASAETITNLRSMAVPTFQGILQTIAPPISSHERLQIHITHDLRGYPSLDPTIYAVFQRVMAQVEGGDLMVVQRGMEVGGKREEESGWQDGPWWRSEGERSVEAVKGLVEGTKLARVQAEGFATDFFKERGGLEEAAKRATETLGESNPTRDSHIFLAVQGISRDVEAELFQGSSSSAEAGTKDATAKHELLFAIYLHDPIHGIAFHNVSQAIPMQWIEWINAPAGVAGSLPESIEEIIEGGGVDPREWISEWMEETLSLSIGVVAQQYVARRMGVGEESAKGGKLKADMNTASMVESGGGEAARAMGGM